MSKQQNHSTQSARCVCCLWWQQCLDDWMHTVPAIPLAVWTLDNGTYCPDCTPLEKVPSAEAFYHDDLQARQKSCRALILEQDGDDLS